MAAYPTMAWRRIETAPLRGRFLLGESALIVLEQTLPTFRGYDGAHEGIAFLCGLEIPGATVLTTAIVPEADHGRGHVRCTEAQMAAVTKAARDLGLGVLAQVHTHPGHSAVHSIGDDEMVLMPFEGMLSIVCPDYGRYGLRPLDSLGIHQFQDGRWILATRTSVCEGLTLLESGVDLR